MKKILVVGSTGQLAQHLRELLPGATFWSRADADLSVPETLEGKVLAIGPSCIVNAAAYTAVDRAESEPELAWRVNSEAPAALARAAARLDAPIIQVSTDYVFDGSKKEPYEESAPVGPLSVYGMSKLGGELSVRAIHRKHWILRTSWVFSEYGGNFVKTMLRLAKERTELSVVADQIGRPTYAGDLARLIAVLSQDSESLPFGIYHATGGPATSWHGFATRIFEQAERIGLIDQSPLVHPIPTTSYPTPAKRPLNSVLKPSSALETIASFDWETGLRRTLSNLK